MSSRSGSARNAGFVYVKAFAPGQSAEAFARLRRATCERDALPAHVMHFADLDLITWRFPADPTLVQLVELVRPQRLMRHLPLDGLGLAAATMDPSRLDFEVINYRPEQRCTMRIRIGSRYPAISGIDLFAKAYHDVPVADIHARMRRLWAAHSDGISSVEVPRPIAFDAALNILWIEGVPGDPLDRKLLEHDCTPAVAQTGRALAALHASDAGPVPHETREAVLAETRKRAAKLCSEFPIHRRFLDQVIADLEAIASDRIPLRQCLVHGDFHARQVIVRRPAPSEADREEPRVTIVDLDELALGEPAADLASFIVDLACGELPHGLVGRMAQVLVENYRAASEFPLPDASLDWYITVQLITKAARFQIQRQPGLESRVARLMTAVDVVLTRLHGATGDHNVSH